MNQTVQKFVSKVNIKTTITGKYYLRIKTP